MAFHTFEQGTPEWFSYRAGRVTASMIEAVMATIKSGEAATRKNYRAQIIAERLLGGPLEQGFKSDAMERGNELEDEARATYELLTNNEVHQIAFADHPEIEMCGASPDGLIGDIGGLEIKVPNTATHIATMMGGKIKRGYMLQMQHQMSCCNRKWVDFVSYDPRLPDEYAMHIQRVHRDDSLIADIDEAIVQFLADVESEMEALKQAVSKAA